MSTQFQYDITGRPDFGFLTVQIPADQTLKVEASAMAAMDTNVRMKTKFKGGFKRFLTGESLFINEFTAENGPGKIEIAPGPAGDVQHLRVGAGGDYGMVFLQSAAYVASGMDVNIETKWQGFIKGFFSGESLFLIRCSGDGDLWFNTYGAMIEREINGEYVVDTGHIVAFTEGLEYGVEKVGGYKSLFFSGEGLVCRFRGQGKLWMQTRRAPALAMFMNPFRRTRRRQE